LLRSFFALPHRLVAVVDALWDMLHTDLLLLQTGCLNWFFILGKYSRPIKTPPTSLSSKKNNLRK
jgi:hypothetical protein